LVTRLKRNKNLTNIFRSTTIRLTGWYLVILMTLSLVFSVAIYQVTTSEVQTRIEVFRTSLQGPPHGMMPSVDDLNQTETIAQTSLSMRLLYVNILILLVGGFVSYFLARRSLIPIEKSHDSQSRFTSDASHELRTPLAIIKTEIEVAIRDSNATMDDLRQTLSSNLEEVNKLSKLSEMLLSLSQLENANLKMSPINLDKITRKVVNSFDKTSKRISISTQKRLMVIGNDVAIYDLIKVLVDNSIQYSLKDSKIYIDISQEDGFAKLNITNNGPGIDKEKLPYIFDRFFRADSSRTNGSHKGYGLGLALAKNIVSLHSGDLIVSSEPDKETTFTLLLPLNSKVQAKN